MFLKTLSLRGFKSFADKVTLRLEPGITAVVGPNGSGKSNISDAVLWVLGERNAKNLRGQAMEDVIFSGSSARKPTSVAEVELVLDNSDRTLPVDFDEVSIARRMYRSGESEYLINGVVSRRMDVLEILHDSGLGSGTHSIISQGALDSVLQSKPEDRRALIEEAAGVLKHKQRMAKSARKLERMSAHVDRVGDIAGEVARQLGPLERKAKRALKHAELSEELAQIKLVLAVDDLRSLKAEHGRITERESMAEEQCQARHGRIQELDGELSKLQERIREDSLDASQLSKSYQQITAAAERLDSTSLLMRDRRRAALGRASELEVRIQQSAGALERAQAKLLSTQGQAQEDKAAAEEAQGRVDSLTKQVSALSDSITQAQKRSKESTDVIAALESEDRTLRDKLARAKEQLANSNAQIKVIEGHKAELTVQIDQLSADARIAQAEAQAEEEALAALDEQEKGARTLVGSCMQAREEARRAADEAAAQERSLLTQIEALEQIEAAEGAAASGAPKLAAQALEEKGSPTRLLSHLVKAPKELELLVEALLSADLSALVVPGAAEVEVASSAVREDEAGSVTLLMAQDASQARSAVSDAGSAALTGQRLLDLLTVAPEERMVVASLLGDVILCSSLEEALSAHAEDKAAMRFATPEGDIVFPSGKVMLNARAKGAESGVLSRLRRIEELKASLEQAKASTVRASVEAERAEEALMRAQTESLDLKEKLASLKGSAQGARQAADAAAQKLSSITRELEALEKTLEEESGTAQAALPDIQAMESRLAEISSQVAESRSVVEQLEAQMAPEREELEEASAKLAEARLESAKLAERSTYSERVIQGALAELESLQASREEDGKVLAVKQVSARRLEPVLSLLDVIAQAARRTMSALEDASTSAKSSTDSLHAQMQQLREAARQAQDAYDSASEALAAIRVDKARAEMQVQAAVTVITEDCQIPLERALLTPAPEDRSLMEEESFRLTRRITNLGTITPDAAQEYEELKVRHDYLQSQLADLRSAARSLSRINRVIEERMKDDFARTFEEVNENFKAIFSALFPGGSAYLSLDKPEDIEEAGIEVNAQPAGKRITKMSLMSGGEKSLTALALLFALYKTRATPFYILDEVEAALDDSNLRRLTSYIDQMRATTQLIMITHQRRTMEMADVLFGVSMQADGVTKVLSQKLEDALRTKAS